MLYSISGLLSHYFPPSGILILKSSFQMWFRWHFWEVFDEPFQPSLYNSSLLPLSYVFYVYCIVFVFISFSSHNTLTYLWAGSIFQEYMADSIFIVFVGTPWPGLTSFWPWCSFIPWTLSYSWPSEDSLLGDWLKSPEAIWCKLLWQFLNSFPNGVWIACSLKAALVLTENVVNIIVPTSRELVWISEFEQNYRSADIKEYIIPMCWYPIGIFSLPLC